MPGREPLRWIMRSYLLVEEREGVSPIEPSADLFAQAQHDELGTGTYREDSKRVYKVHVSPSSSRIK